MEIFGKDNERFQFFIENTENLAERLSQQGTKNDIQTVEKLIDNFKIKIEDFYRENRKLNIGVIGQVKAGKSSFLNTLLFNGQEILPKASTPKTATLTKMEYSEQNIIQVEYYSVEEWDVLVDNASVDLEDEIYTSAREIVGMVRRNGVDPLPYLKMGHEEIHFDTYDDLIANLNTYVGEDGTFTPIVKAVTLYLNKEEFRGLSIVDTPGLNDPIASRTIRTKEFMEVCDVVFFLSQAGSFLDKSDWTLLSSQLPQKGVKRLVLIASKYDSGVRDILRVQEEDDIFGDDDNTTDNIPTACKMIQRKLRKRAKTKVEEFVRDLSARECTSELIEVIKQCSEPILVSSIAHNMSGKSKDEYNKEEQNIYSALKNFSDNMERDLHLLGNFDEVNNIFTAVATEKELILERKAKNFVPTAQAELCGVLNEFREKATKRLAVLEKTDREQLLEQKKFIESQMGRIRADIASVFGELNVKLESEKSEAIREIREASKDYLDIKGHTGSVTRTGSYTTGHLWWKKRHYYTYQEHYSYTLASDAIDNLRKFSTDAVNQVEKVFYDALELKEIKRKLLNVVVQNFDMGSETYDSSLFRIMVEDTINKIEFPVFNMDISTVMGGIAAKFTGELTSVGEQTQLAEALSTAITRIHEAMCEQLKTSVAEFKSKLKEISIGVEEKLLENIKNEFDDLLSQYQNKEREIERYTSYISMLSGEIAKL